MPVVSLKYVIVDLELTPPRVCPHRHCKQDGTKLFLSYETSTYVIGCYMSELYDLNST